MITLFWIIGVYLLLYSLYWLALVILGQHRSGMPHPFDQFDSPEVLLIFPAYRPGKIFHQVLDSAATVMKGRKMHALVLLQEADSDEYQEHADRLGFHVISQSFTHLRGNAYQHALRFIADFVYRKRLSGHCNPEFVLLVDKDNIISPDFFNVIPPYVYDHYDVIQGRRTPMSMASPTAFFDAMAESMNDVMFRAAKERIGGMVELSGSGALIETDLFLATVKRLDEKAPGFDKNFMVQLLTRRREIRSVFWPYSCLREEKTSSLAALQPQRTRWYGEQYYNALFHCVSLLRAAVKYRRWQAFDYLATLWRPPRIVHMTMVPLAGMIELGLFLYNGTWPLGVPVFGVAGLATVMAVVVFLAGTHRLWDAFRHVGSVPALLFSNLLSVAGSLRKKNRSQFIHTPHQL